MRLLVQIESLTIYRSMFYLLGLFVTLAAALSFSETLSHQGLDILIQSLMFAAACWFFNFLGAKLFRTKTNIESPLITGLILALIIGPTSVADWPIILGVSFAAMASKYLLVRNSTHIFNPAAFGALVAAVVFNEPASWWIGDQSLFWIILIGGILIIRKMKRFHLVGSFIFPYAALLLGFYGTEISDSINIIRGVVLSPSLLFFCSIMLIEPLTSPQTKEKRIYFGLVVAVILFLLQRFAVNISYSLEVSLLFGNLFVAIIDPHIRQNLILKKIEEINPMTKNFWFVSPRPFKFKPGQFLEYTLAHSQPDIRGFRRYFTIASSPTEEEILLTTKFSDLGSTFKKELIHVPLGGKIIASHVAGDFTLPSDRNKKLGFIAGGIGVTPFRSMTKYLLDTNESRNITLLYSAKTESDILFSDIFNKASEKMSLQIIHVISESTSGIKKIDAELIQSRVNDFMDRVWYISGPEPMVDAMNRILLNLGISSKNIKRDYFPGY